MLRTFKEEHYDLVTNVFNKNKFQDSNPDVVKMNYLPALQNFQILNREFIFNKNPNMGEKMEPEIMKLVYMEPDSTLEVVPTLKHGLEYAVRNPGILPISQIEKLK